MKFQPKCLGYVNMNIPLTHGFEVNLACLHLIRPRRQQEECESAIVVRGGGLGFRTIRVSEVKSDAREDRAGGVQSHACQRSGGRRLAMGPAGKRQAQGDQVRKFQRRGSSMLNHTLKLMRIQGPGLTNYEHHPRIQTAGAMAILWVSSQSAAPRF